MAQSGFSFESEMADFIRENLRDNQRVRSKGAPEFSAPPVVNQTTTTFNETRYPIPAPFIPSGEVIGGGGGEHPFKITGISGEEPKYIVSANSSIVDGINGDAFSITGLGEERPISESKFIVAEAEVTSVPFAVNAAGFTISEVDDANLNEVELAASATNQTKIRLVIGRVRVTESEGDPAVKVVTAVQAVTSSFRTSVSFHNGVPVYILQVAPTHKSILTVGE